MRPSLKYIAIVIPLVLLMFLHEMVFFGKIPLASDTIAHQPISKWAREYVAREGNMPQWFPHLFAGMPSYGGYIYVPANPVNNLLKPIFGNRGVRYWFHFALGGLGIFLLLRRRRFGPISSLFGGLVFGLTPYMFGLINAGHSGKIFAVGYLPFVILGIDYILSKALWRGVLYLGLATALQLWTKHPQIVYYTWMLAVFLWIWPQMTALVRRRWAIRSEGKQTAILAGSILVALILVADPYASIFQFQGHSTRGAESILDTSGETKQGTSWEYATNWSFHPKEMISFLYPYFYGLQNYPTRDAKSAAYWGYMPFTQSTHYLGLLTVLIAVIGLILKKPDKFVTSMLISSALILLVGFGKYVPVLFWPLFKFAPLFSKFRVPSMIYVLLPLTVGALAAIGLENVMLVCERGNQEERRTLKKWGVRLPAAVAVLSLVLLVFTDSLTFVKSGESAQIAVQVIAVRKELFQKGLLLALFVSSGGLAAIWLGIKRTLKPSAVGLSIILLTLVDLWVVDQEFLHLKSGGSMRRQFRPTPEVNFLQKDDDLFRILPLDEFRSNYYAYFGLSSVGGYRPVKLRTYQDLMEAGGLNKPAIWNMLNVKYLISSRSLPNPQLKLVFSGKMNIYENEDVLPKSWMVSEIIEVSSQKESLEKTVSAGFDPARHAVVVDYEGPELPAQVVSGSTSFVEVREYSENEIVLAVSSSEGGLLVLSENYYGPGWNASVDGNPTKIFQTNHVLRSVFVPAGEHSIVFKYDTRLFTVSRLVSRISLVMALLGIAFIHRHSIRGRSPD